VTHPIVVIIRAIGPYHEAPLRAAAATCRISAVELGETDGINIWDRSDTGGYPRTTLFPGRDGASVGYMEMRARLGEALDRLGPAAVAIPGWHGTGTRAALAWCAAHGVPAILMSDSAAEDAVRRWPKEAIKARLVSLCGSALVAGARHARYLETLGMPSGRIFLGYDVVDNDHFARPAGADAAERTALRSRLGLPPSYVVACGRFIARKNHAFLLQAYARYLSASPSPRHHLVLIGDGPLRTQLETQARALGIVDRIVFTGAIGYAELPSYYALAHALVHPSTVEQWGLVVNEAMASGLPVLVSRSCGCAEELVAPGENGRLFDPDDVDALAAALGALDTVDTAEMSTASRRIIASWSPRRFADGLRDAAAAAVPRKATAIDHLLLRLLPG
jgi:glycosyltransferase involved in cell wall biosynthesis